MSGKYRPVIEKFLRYVRIDTQSLEESDTTPSTMKQHRLAGILAEELEAMGASEITYDREYCYVYGTIPASPGFENEPVLGFIAHMDTSPAVSGENVKPRIVERYDGGDVLLNEAEQIVLRVDEFPSLRKLVGQDLIVTDGTTLLGADDKAGVAEIMAMAEYLLTHPEIPHGRIRVGFTPDEEVGSGADHFDVALFGADYAYTVDGGALGELEYENFNAAGARLTVHGRSVHPGGAKGKLRNAILMAQQFQNLLPALDVPEHTEGYQGFIHVDHIQGNVEKVVADYIIRDHDRERFEERKTYFMRCADWLNKQYGEGAFEAEIRDSYYNMKEILAPHMHLIDHAAESMRKLGFEPVVSPIRGGTDGARLSFMGLPCPNLCTGGGNFHSRYEYASIQAMELCSELLVELATVG